MATVLLDGFDDGSIQKINEWIKRLEAILSVESPKDFLGRIEEHLHRPAESDLPLSPYTPDEFGVLIGKSGDAVREACRNGRIIGYKIKAMAGDKHLWRIAHSELIRYRAEGFLPAPKQSNHNSMSRPKRISRPGISVSNGVPNVTLK